MTREYASHSEVKKVNMLCVGFRKLNCDKADVGKRAMWVRCRVHLKESGVATENSETHSQSKVWRSFGLFRPISTRKHMI